MRSNSVESDIAQRTIEDTIGSLAEAGITLRIRQDFEIYAAVRLANGMFHVNQAFDPRHSCFGNDDFWLLALDSRGEAVATYCVRHLVADDFYDLIRSSYGVIPFPAMGFGNRPHVADPPFVVASRLPVFDGEIIHEGGCWVRHDYRGRSKQPRLSHVLSRLARAVALRNRPFDYDTGMILNDPRDPLEVTSRKAVSLGIEAYGFAGLHQVNGWYPPEGRNATLHLCYSTRVEALASLAPQSRHDAPRRSLRCFEFRQEPLMEQNEQLIDASSISGQWQQEPGVGVRQPVREVMDQLIGRHTGADDFPIVFDRIVTHQAG